MDLRFTPEEIAFRQEVRAFIRDNLPTDIHAKMKLGHGPSKEDTVRWQRILNAKGWAGMSWPTQWGGPGWTAIQKMIFLEENQMAPAPELSSFNITMIGPVLLQFGTEEQKQRFLPKIQAVDELWCQGYSEPNAGSDLSNVQTRAVLDGDEWVVNGQKVWTTLAHRADWCFCIARTDPDAPAHKGLSYLLIPMHQAGVTVQPIHQMTGTAEFNEVFFDDARTNRSMVLGEVNDGWRVAMATLGFERGTAFLGQQLAFQRELTELIDVAHGNGTAAEPVFRQRLAQAFIGVQIMKYNGLRMLTGLARKGVLGPEASIGKLFWSTWHRNLGELAMDVLGPAAGIIEGESSKGYELNELQRNFMFSRSETIYAGASEIQRNIIGERVLGLPREPR
jgi:alkylation response protein AidB-like acyl-CoA dehydrogenase